jgi:PTH1 family peptidyl-tRNA hydrolase
MSEDRSAHREPVGDEPARLVVGLGNPGERYAATRHNVGFRVVELLAARSGVRLDRLECQSRVAWRGPVGFAQPQTFMNRSGYAVRCLAERHGLLGENILVVYDEIALPLGRLRLRPRGSPAGHRGMESVIENLRGSEVPRLRLGVAGDEGPPLGEGLVEFVLAPFEADEVERVEAMIERAADACECWLEEGAEAAMNRFNG